MKLFLVSGLCILFPFWAESQLTAPLQQLQQHILQDSLLQDSGIIRNPLYDLKGFNYLKPIYRHLAALGSGKMAGRFAETPGKFTIMAQDFAFAGDYLTAALYGQKDYDSISAAGYQDARLFLDTMKSVQFRDARGYILSRAAEERVIMINEAHHMAMHRAFILGLLKDFYQSGFRYLAMELLNNRSDRSLGEVDIRTGYFTAEPIAGELVRKALDIGFTLVPYEDTLSDNHSGTGRDAIQAARIAAILQKDPAAKILVLAGHAHISEAKIGKDYIPMAVAFRRFTGINPFTIDLTEMCEGSSFEYGRYFYQLLTSKIRLKEPVIAFRNDTPVSLLENDHYDVQVILPLATPIHNRPGWLSLNGQRKEFAVRPTEKKLFMVQAYYLNEANKKPIGMLVPADQTYISGSDGYYWLYLFPGKYKIVLRDMDYNILSTKEAEVPQ
ncbi:hypothetical protein [Flavihumibacter profundi]|uniref:hypothetical protein n=1 Tax=Flavihumibacter profundi TaxID=2716883 RepID=UPI001CC7F560|nr:hypothetical protein [Flavihumibacter profundi]MBZ5856169.1 hypothetical protein [Flavihumibacter profundi]